MYIYIYIHLHLHTPFVFFCSMYHHVSCAGFSADRHIMIADEVGFSTRRGFRVRCIKAEQQSQPCPTTKCRCIYIYIPYMDPMGVEWKFIYTFEKNNMDTTKIPQKSWKKNPLNEQKTHHFVWLPCWFFRSGPTTSFIRFFRHMFRFDRKHCWEWIGPKARVKLWRAETWQIPKGMGFGIQGFVEDFDWETNKDLHLSLVLQEIFLGHAWIFYNLYYNMKIFSPII